MEPKILQLRVLSNNEISEIAARLKTNKIRQKQKKTELVIGT